MSGAVALTALKIGAAAIGGWTILSKVLGALAGWSKTPAWAQPIVALIAGLIGAKTTAAQKIEVAEKAGNEAVAANRPPGMTGTTDAGTPGKIREVE